MKARTTLRLICGRLRAALMRHSPLLPPEVHYVGGSDNLPPPLTAEEERNLPRREDFLRPRLDHLQRAVWCAERQFKVTGVEERKVFEVAVLQRRICFDSERLRTDRRRPEPRSGTKARSRIVRRAEQNYARWRVFLGRCDECCVVHDEASILYHNSLRPASTG